MQLRSEIAGRLEALVEPSTHQSAVKRVYIAGKFYRGPYKDNAPDLIVGYQRGYRVSWEAAIGKTTRSVFQPNTKAWSGDHCVDPSLVPGILFCTHRIANENPRLIDVAPTVLSMFGIAVPDYMDGKASTWSTRNAKDRWSTRRRPGGGRIMSARCRPEDHAEDLDRGRGRRGGRWRGGLGAGNYWLGSRRNVSRSAGKKVIIIGIDGMDPRLSERMMKEGLLPNLEKLRAGAGSARWARALRRRALLRGPTSSTGPGRATMGFSTSSIAIPRSSAHRFYSAAETIPGVGAWEMGDYRLPLDFWPFNHKPTDDGAQAAGNAVLGLPGRRRGAVDVLRHSEQLSGEPVASRPPSVHLRHGHARHAGPLRHVPAFRRERTCGAAGRRGWEAVAGSRLTDDGATARLVGPEDGLLKKPKPIGIEFRVHRDREAVRPWSRSRAGRSCSSRASGARWTKLDFTLSRRGSCRVRASPGICRFYLQEVAPNFRLYVSPINMDPRAPALTISEPASFVKDVSGRLGPFATTGFQEDYTRGRTASSATTSIARQAGMVLEARLALLDYALENYEDGLLFFYFSSSDLQSHMFWWDSDDPHPIRSDAEAKKYFGHVYRLYRKLDQVIGDSDGPIRPAGDA